MGFPWTEQITQSMTVAAAGINAAAQTAATYLTSAVDMKLFRKVVFVVNLGTLGGSGTINFSVTAAKTSGGTYVAVTGTAITQLTTGGGTVLVEVSADHLQNLLGNGYEFLKGSLVVGVATSPASVVVLGAISDHEPTSNNADASLLQTVVL